MDRTDENPVDDEDDSWLDEPDIEVFPPEHSLDVSSNIDMSSKCLAATLSEESAGDDSEGPQLDCPKSSPGPGGPRSRPVWTPNVRVQVQLVSGPDPDRTLS